MSQLAQLKQQIGALSNDAKSTAQGLRSFKGKFSRSVGEVSAVIGGSAQQVDKRMIQTLQAAEKQVDEAIAALEQAAAVARSYAASL